MKSRSLRLLFLGSVTVFFLAGDLPAQTAPRPGVNLKAPQPGLSAKTAPSKAATVRKTDPNAVVATVNGVKITEAEVRAGIISQLRNARMRQAPPPRLMAQFRQQALDSLIGRILVDEQVKKSNIVVTEQDVNDHINKMAAQQGMTLDKFKELIKGYAGSFENWKEQMQLQKKLAYQKLFDAKFAGKTDVTDENAQKYYAENPKQFKMPEQAKASHILIKPEAEALKADPNAAKAAAKAKAQGLLKQVKGGADFAALAKAHSDCDTAKNDQLTPPRVPGDLGFFNKGRMEKPFEQAAFSLKVGEISDVVETGYGYHIIKVTDHKDAGMIPLEEVKDKVIARITGIKQRQLTIEYVDALKAKAKIVYAPGHEPKPAPAINPAQAPAAPK